MIVSFLIIGTIWYLLLWTECLYLPPKFICCDPNPQCYGFRTWCLWRVFRSWGRSLHDGTSAFIKETLENSPSLLLTCEDTARWPSVNQVLGLCWPGSCWPFELGLPVSRTMRNEFLLFLSHPVMVLCYSSPNKRDIYSMCFLIVQHRILYMVDTPKYLVVHWLVPQDKEDRTDWKKSGTVSAHLCSPRT